MHEFPISDAVPHFAASELEQAEAPELIGESECVTDLPAEVIRIEVEVARPTSAPIAPAPRHEEPDGGNPYMIAGRET